MLYKQYPANISVSVVVSSFRHDYSNIKQCRVSVHIAITGAVQSTSGSHSIENATINGENLPIDIVVFREEKLYFGQSSRTTGRKRATYHCHAHLLFLATSHCGHVALLLHLLGR